MIILTEKVTEANRIKLENQIKLIKRLMEKVSSKADKNYYINKIHQLKIISRLKNE